MNKGPVDTKIDTAALNEIIIFANQYKNDLDEKATEISNICDTMKSDESLAGGSGENIRAAFEAISVATSKLKESTEKIASSLDETLGKALEAGKDAQARSVEETATAKAKKAGVYNKE